MYSSRLIDTAYLEIRWGVSSVVPRPVEPKLPLVVMVLLTSRTETPFGRYGSTYQ